MKTEYYGPVWLGNNERLSIEDGEVLMISFFSQRYRADVINPETDQRHGSFYTTATGDSSNEYNSLKDLVFVGPAELEADDESCVVGHEITDLGSYDTVCEYLDGNDDESVFVPDGEVWHVAAYCWDYPDALRMYNPDGDHRVAVTGTAQTDVPGYDNHGLYTFVGPMELEAYLSEVAIMGFKETI
ncbi:hypothetical protein [Halopiger goleimassiliensis]|uniref:hypothetical protein n=1 Tax=Halopiger goleimassiliensis TaxID=1293048 RepID=UPI0006775D02|nr:hypothetical protein [Halopiger goleimassiliensis]